MALTQLGYLGQQGPVFRDDSAGGGKYYLFQGRVYNGVMKLVAVQPAYAANLGPTGTYLPSDYTLGSYADNQVVSDAPAYTQPTTGANFQGYMVKGTDWVTATTVAGNTPAAGNPVTTTGTTTTGGTTTTTTTGTTTTGTTTGGDTTFSAPTVMEQITTFLTNYWWLVLIVLVFVLWKPVLAPAFGLGKKSRRR